MTGLDPSDPAARILNPAIKNSFFQLRTDSAGSIVIDNLTVETVADSVPLEEPEEPEVPEEPEPPVIIPKVNLPFIAGFAGVTEDIFSSSYASIKDATDLDVAMFTNTGGSVTVVENGLELDGGRFTIGNTVPGTNSTSADTASTGAFNLSRPYNIVMDIVAVSFTDATKKLQVYVDNNTSGSANSIHEGASRIYNEEAGNISLGTLTIPGTVGTTNSFIQIRTEGGATVVVDNIRIEYLNENLLTSENFDTTTELFFTADYKALPGDASTEVYHITGGGSGLTITNGQLKIDSARFSLGNTTPAVETTADDTITTGIYDLSRPYQIIFDVVATEDLEANNNLLIYVDNNTSSSGKSKHGSDSKFYSELILSLVPGETLVVDGYLATQSSFLQFRTESGGVVVIDNLRIEYLAEDDPGAKIFSCADAPELYFCDDFNNGSVANYELLAMSNNTTGAIGSFDTLEDDGNVVLRYTAGDAGGEIMLFKDSAMANVPASADYFVEARIRPRQNSKTANKQIYLLGRYESEGNWYAGGLNVQNSSSSTQVEVAVSVATSLSRPVQSKSPILLGEKDGIDGVWYTVRFEMIGSDLSVYLNGELMGTTSDSTYTTKGLIGMFTNNRSFEIDDIKVGDPSIKPVQLTLDYKDLVWSTSTSADPLVINITAVKNDGVTADSFTVKSSDSGVVTAQLNGSVLTLQALTAGTSNIYIKSGSDNTIVRTIDVTVAEGFVMPTQSYGDFSAKVTPTVGMTDEYIDSTLSITFDSAPTLGSIGEVRIYDASNNTLVDTINVGNEVDALGYAGQERVRRVNVNSLSVNGNTLNIKLHNSLLDYGQTYYVVIGDGVVGGTQLNGVDFVGLGENSNWYFATKASAPSTNDLTVDDDGAADFRTVQGALNYTMQHVAKDAASTIMVKDGTYNELLYLRDKNNLTITGESRENTIIQYDNYESKNSGSGTSEAPSAGAPAGGRSVFLVEGADLLTLTNLTLKNTHLRASPGSAQAETIYFNSNYRLVAKDANFISEQDTLLLKGYSWFYNTLVAGNVDFIWGYPVTALFEESEIRTIGDSKNNDPNTDTSGGYILQARVPVSTDPGFIFLNSEFTHGPGPIGNDVLDNSTYIARSGGNSSYYDNVTLINNKFDTHIATSGWAVLGVNSQPAPNPAVPTATSGWREYGSMDMSGNALDLSARAGGYLMQQADVANLSDRGSIFASYNGNQGWDPAADNTPIIGVILTDTGFAGYNFDLTGGAGGITVTVDNGVSLINALEQASDTNMPITIYVDGTITDANSGGQGRSIDIKDMDNVSIIGVADRGEFDGIGIQIRRANNIIIQNLKIHHVLTGGKDAISIEGDNDGSTTENIWIDHNELYSTMSVDKDYYDGLIDTKSGAKNITISYNYLHDHWKASLHGHTEPDTASSNTDRNITFHHNRFENIESRLPLFRYGHGHLYNNYYNEIHSTGINSRREAELLIENNVFENTQNPIVSFYTDVVGYWNLSGNILGEGVTWTTPGTGEINAQDGQSTSSYVVPYDYELEAAEVVKTNVINLSGIGKLDQSGLDIPAIDNAGQTPTDTDVSLPYGENFSAADAATFFSADYKNVPGDSTVALYNITGGGSGITITDGQISLASARFTLGHATPAVETTANDISGVGVFDLSKPYKIVMDIISVGGSDTSKDFQIYVDNNTSSSSKSMQGSASKFYAVDAGALTVGTLEIDGLVATANSFLQIRTETGATVVIDNLRIEYLPPDALYSEDFGAADAATFFTADYKGLPDDAASPMYNITGGGSGITITDGQISLASARFTVGHATPTLETTADDVAGAGVFDLSKPYKVIMDIISVGGDDTTKDFQVYVDNNTSSSSKSIHGGSSKFYAVDASTLTVGTLEIDGFIATSTSFLQIRTETGATVLFDNLRIQYTE